MSTVTNDEFRERVRVRLAVMGLSQNELCNNRGVSPQSFSNWLTSIPNIHLSTLYKIADMLEVSPSWLLEGDLKDAVPAKADVAHF